MGWGRAQGLQAESSGPADDVLPLLPASGYIRRDYPRRQRSHGTEAEYTEQPDM